MIGEPCQNSVNDEETVLLDSGLFNSVYLVDMPGIGSDGTPYPNKRGDYYCDSVDYHDGSPQCQEIDIMQANIWELKTAVHNCDLLLGCDMVGCS